MDTDRRRRGRGLGVLVFGTIIGVAGTVAVYSFFGGESKGTETLPGPAPVFDTTPSELIAPSAGESRLQTIESELVAALARIDSLYAEREWQLTAAWVETLLDSGGKGSSTRLAHLEKFRRKLDIRKQAESEQGWAGIDDALMMLVATLLAGDEAIDELCGLAADRSVDMAVREEAIQSLGYIPSEQSLRLLLNPPEDLAEAVSYQPADSLDRFAHIVDFLPTETVSPHAAGLYALAANALHENAENNNAWKLVAALGFEHGHPDALKLLNDPRMTGYFGEDLIQIAWWAGNDASHAYLERLSRAGASPEIRQKAAEVLAGWP
jgi:hypothetical protein